MARGGANGIGGRGEVIKFDFYLLQKSKIVILCFKIFRFEVLQTLV